MKQLKVKINNPWRVGFFILFGLMVAMFLFLVIKITSVPEIKNIPRITSKNQEESAFLVQLTKEQTNKLIQPYLEEFQKDSPLKYEFTIAEEAILSGNFEFLGYELEYGLYFEPKVLENGEVQLFAKDISIGTLSLPVSEVMKIVGETIELPSWIGINSTNQTFTIYLEEFILENGMHFKVKEINLQEDRIQVNVYLPETF